MATRRPLYQSGGDMTEIPDSDVLPSGIIPLATTSTPGALSADDKTKLDTIPSGTNMRKAVSDLGNRSTALTIDVSNVDEMDVFLTLTASITITIVGGTAGKKVYIGAKQGGSGGYTITWVVSGSGGALLWGATLSFVTTAGHVNSFGLVCHPGNVWYGNSTKYAASPPVAP